MKKKSTVYNMVHRNTRMFEEIILSSLRYLEKKYIRRLMNEKKLVYLFKDYGTW